MAICPELDIVPKISVLLRLNASPTNVVASTLPKEPVEDKLELTLPVAVILPATSTDELTVFTDRIEVPLEFSTDKASPLFPLITTVSEPC